MADKKVDVEIGGNASGLQSATQAASAAVKNASAAIKEAMAGVKESFAGVSQGVGKLTNDFKTFGASASARIKEDAAAINNHAGKAADGIKGLAESGKSSFDGLTSSIAKVNVAMAAIAVVVGGGAAFKQSVNDVVEYTTANNKLARQMGVGATEASIMNMALGDIGSSSESYGSALNFLNKQIKTNESGLNEQGIATRNANGELLTGQEVMKNAVKRVGEFKEGQDQALISMVAFGKGAEETMKFQKLNNEVMADAKKKTEELGLTTTASGVESVKKYKAALNDMNDVFDGVSNAIGEALLPGLTSLANAFAEYGPTAVGIMREAMTTYLVIQDTVVSAVKALIGVFNPIFDAIGTLLTGIFGEGGTGVTALDVFKNALGIVQIAFIAMRTGIETACAIIEGVINSVKSVMRGFAEVAIGMYEAIEQRSLAPLVAAFRRADAAVVDDFQKTQNKLLDIANKGAEDMKKAAMGETRPRDTTPAAKVASGGTETFKEEDDKKKKTKTPKAPKAVDEEGKLQDAERALQKAKTEAETNLIKQQQKAEIADLDDLYARKKITIEKYYENKASIMDRDYARQIELKKADIADSATRTPKNDMERIKLQTEQIKLEGQLKLIEAQRAEAAVENSRKLSFELEKRKEAIAQMEIDRTKENNLQLVQLEQIKNDQMLALHQIDDTRMIELNQERENKIYDIVRSSIERRRALAEGDIDKQRDLDAELEALARDHQVKIAEIRSDGVINAQKDNLSIYESSRSALASSIADVMKGQKSIKEGFKNLFDSVLDMIIKLQSEKIAKSIMGGLDIGGLLGGVGQSSGSGGGGLGGIFGSVMNLFGGGKSAGGGGDVLGAFIAGLPSYDVGTNYVPNDQFVKVHKGEAIVPAKYNNEDSSKNKTNVYNITQQFNVGENVDRRSRLQIGQEAGAGIAASTRRV